MSAQMKFLTTLFLAFLMPVVSAYAALITIDTSIGANTAVFDTQSNLQWLKISVTRDLSFNQVVSETADGGRLADFRYGTAQEVQCNLIYANLTMGCGATQTNQDVAAVKGFMDILGIRSGDSVIYAPIPPEQNPSVTQGSIETFESQFIIRNITNNPVDFDTQRVTFLRDRPNVHFLVRDTQEIPVPGTTALLGAGWIGLMALRKMAARNTL